MDPQSVVGALNALKAASDIAKGLRAIESGYEKAELKLKIIDLMELLSDARTGVLEAQEEIRGLQARIQELEAAEDLRDKLVMRDSMYYLVEASGEKGPYCVRCYETDQQLMPLTEQPWQFREFGRWQCPECKRLYGTKSE